MTDQRMMPVSAPDVSSPPSTASDAFSFNLEHKWLQLPVRNGAPKHTVEVWVDGVMERRFEIELADGTADWNACLDTERWRGKKAELKVDPPPTAGSRALAAIVQVDDRAIPGTVYDEPLRPQFHFTAARGWLNDPNGLAFYNGEYHLFYQHNPYGVQWGNMHWGHAVSVDLVHWKQRGVALYPDATGTMFSGCGVVDWNNTSGLARGRQPPLVLHYTSAGDWTQGLAWSIDGERFEKLPEPILPMIARDNRDPKVLWHEPTKKWIMVLYVTGEAERHEIHFFSSANLRDWQPESIFAGGVGNDKFLFECPGFYELPISGQPGKKRWVLSAANGEYAVGAFDGHTFEAEATRLPGISGSCYYAAQVFSDDPKHRCIEIGWMKSAVPGRSFNSAMSLPMELGLRLTADGPRLTRQPVQELESLRVKTLHFGPGDLQEQSENPLAAVEGEFLEIRFEFEPRTAKKVKLSARGLEFTYDADRQEVTFCGKVAPAPLHDGRQSVTVYVDRAGAEAFVSDGLTYIPMAVNPDPAARKLALSVSGGEIHVVRLDVHQLRSAWN